jgi:hypothetical protein
MILSNVIIARHRNTQLYEVDLEGAKDAKPLIYQHALSMTSKDIFYNVGMSKTMKDANTNSSRRGAALLKFDLRIFSIILLYEQDTMKYGKTLTWGFT